MAKNSRETAIIARRSAASRKGWRTRKRMAEARAGAAAIKALHEILAAGYRATKEAIDDLEFGPKRR